MLGFSHHINKKAIAYYRHSAEDKQENSVAIQREHTENFARENNIDIIHEESDEGKSGLTANRPGFERLFANWVENNNAPSFSYVLVYDVSRWGRFQDGDQAAYFVHLCKKHGKEVIYVSRGFPDQANQLFSSLETSIQRYMAAEYSRQLSDKVFHGCIKVSQQGYSAGGSAVYGMTRLLLDVNKEIIRPLKLGEHKQIANERVSFAPKNDETTVAVKTIYDLFVNKRYSISDIVNFLNEKEILSANGKLWDRSKIIKVLTQEAYIGTRIYNKTKGRLKQKIHSNPRSEWVVVPKAFKATIDEQVFIKAQERLYWILPNNWRKGINAIKKAKKNLYQDIFRWLLNKGLTDFDIDEIVHKLPIVFGIKVEQESISRWCFVITEDARKYDNILGVGVVSNSKKVIDNFFLFSTQDFTKTNFLIFQSNSRLYHNSRIETQNIELSIGLLIKQLKNSKQRYKTKYRFIECLL
ncbi:DNA invertase Pin-like site-specific DNA recombinase [Elizabethkingia sp. YR214]|uniref:recombinase family protein n=1 Tax=Elizabethkingia sp. YR214 TaxID=2135667 RepID=UPI000D30F300|nr:recombinase family protein [Elizabethkingia sp. YR214]PUB33716.1 DNA invertase Pin-like site-specific DNA recombinase [Elizabethkingia sp. YR214]